ncbi:MAG: DUF3187 family protein [Dokdonella sp.]|nr:DUF3187 family protein [Dokdonella sp.]
MAERVPRALAAAGLAVALQWLAPGAARAAGAAWLPYRDANPFVAAGGLPLAPPSVAADGWRVDLVASASNTELAFDRGSEHLLYDAELHEGRIAVTRGLGEHWLARVSLAAVSLDDGFLDGFLQDWHRVFGLSNGDRGQLGSDGHVIDYHDPDASLHLDRRLRAATPLLVDLAWRAPAGAASEWMLGATLKLPTSRASVLVDDRAVDASVWLAAQSTATQSPLSWGARLGALRRGDGDLLPARRKRLVPFADVALGWQLTPAWDASAQLQWHAALYDSRIPYLRDATTLALSSGWRMRSGWTLRAGLVEDVQALHAQDVTLFLSLVR